MIEASAFAFDCDYGAMTNLMRRITTPISRQSQEQFIMSIVTDNCPILEVWKHTQVENQEETESPHLEL